MKILIREGVLFIKNNKDFEKVKYTNNNVKVFSYANKHLHSFCICLYLRAGSLFESDEDNGISHFFEHMVFKNINKKYDGKLYDKLDRLGLDFNACTYKEFMQFIITGACVHFEEAAEIITYIFEPIILNASELNTERRRIKSEIRESDEKQSLDLFTQKIVWEGTRLKNSISGTFSNLDKMGIKALKNASNEILSVNNLFFYVTGNFSEKQINSLIKNIEKYPLKSTIPCRSNIAPVPKSFFKRNGNISIKNNTSYYIRLSFDVDTKKYSEAENSIFYDILFEGENSKIHQRLSEKTGYIYSFGSQYERYDNIGNLSVYFEVRPAHIYKAIETVIDICIDMKHNLTDELCYVKPAYVDNAELILDDAEEFNWILAYECHILSEKYKDINERRKSYDDINKERIMEMACDIFRFNNLVITMKAPKDKIDKNKIYDICNKLL